MFGENHFIKVFTKYGNEFLKQIKPKQELMAYAFANFILAERHPEIYGIKELPITLQKIKDGGERVYSDELKTFLAELRFVDTNPDAESVVVQCEEKLLAWEISATDDSNDFLEDNRKDFDHLIDICNQIANALIGTALCLDRMIFEDIDIVEDYTNKHYEIFFDYDKHSFVLINKEYVGLYNDENKSISNIQLYWTKTAFGCENAFAFLLKHPDEVQFDKIENHS